VGVPVRGGAPFLAETLRSIQAQTHHDLEVEISLDGPDPAAEEQCRSFLKDGRFRLTRHPARRGWVDNVNWLVSQVRSPYWCYQPQDDLMHPRYLETLLEAIEARPEAAVSYSDIEAFGKLETTLTQPSVTGRPVARQLALLAVHHSAVAFRGLTRADALRRAGGVQHNQASDFSADTSFMAALARFGELHRVPRTLYSKRYHDDNVHLGWLAWTLEKRVQAWAVHCADMLEQAMLVEATAEERRLLWLASAGRLTSPLASSYVSRNELSDRVRQALLDRFLGEAIDSIEVDVPALLELPWTRVRRLTEMFSLRPDG
jgi:glycosyltransferase involved in cell wall biosynthesis